MKKTKLIIFLIGFLIITAFLGGWLIKGRYSRLELTSIIKNSAPLRLEGFKFIKPVLICDTSPQKELPEMKPLKEKLIALIGQETKNGNISEASVYFQDFKTDGRVDINQNVKFHPASLVKIPLMIVYYKLSESQPSILGQGIKCAGGEDQNKAQEIKPKEYAQVGKEYTVENLIEKMIKYSDNNALSLLSYSMPKEIQEAIYKDLQVPLPLNEISAEEFDYITTKDESYFFRVLYNATYLNRELSEKALLLLSETDYNNGLVAGVPSNIKVGHKFGLKGFVLKNQGVVDSRELHDCGIIYHPKNPYLLCVMTKSAVDIPKIESVIKEISALVYQEVDKYSQ